MSLIKIQGMPVFKPKEGFHYPWAWDYYKTHDRMYWSSDEINLGKDIQDFARADEAEATYITNVMKTFTSNEVFVETGYAILLRIFKPTEVQAMLSNFMAREFTHIENYSLFTETIGIKDSIYSDFLDVPVMSSKSEYVDKAKVRKYEDYKSVGMSDAQVDREFRRAIARMLAVYAGATEGISLMAQFAALLSYQFKGKYPGLCAIVEFSIREETVHWKANSHLFRAFISENMDIWDDELKYDIYQAVREVVAYEHALIDHLNPPHISNESLKRYVEYCADNSLKELGMKPNWNTTENPLTFMDDVVGVVLTDFFSGTVTGYTKQIQGDWDMIDYTAWS
jgi:ribonucleoside-diphosphate reductase beta chain